MQIRFFLALAVLFAAATGAACDIRVNDKGVSLDVNEGGRAEDTWTRSYTIAQGGRFELESAFSVINVVPATGNAVEVLATRTVRGRSDEAAREQLKKIEMKEEVAPDRVRLQPALGEGGGFRALRLESQVKVPAGLNVVITSEFGNVQLDKVQGRFDISATNGRISGTASGGLQAQTVNGQVVMQLTDVTDDVRITTVNGSVTLGLPTNLNATVEATTINGGVMVNDTLPLVASTKDRQRLSGTLGTGTGPRIELSTTNGGVRLGGGEPPT